MCVDFTEETFGEIYTYHLYDIRKKRKQERKKEGKQKF